MIAGSSHRHDYKVPPPRLRAWLPFVLLAAATAFSAACASTPPINYLDADGPRYVGSFASREAVAETVSAGERTFLLASFNVKLGEEPDNALKVLREAGLDKADLLLLYDDDGVEVNVKLPKDAWDVSFPKGAKVQEVTCD